MRTILFLFTMLLVVAAPHCPAQSHEAAAAAAPSEAAPPPPSQAMQGASAPKSAFGRVMAVLIAKLVQDRTQASQAPASQPRAAAGGADGNDAATTLPIDIEVGAAFRTDATRPTVAAAEGTSARDGGGASDAAMQEPEPLTLQAALPADVR
jgi:hypothetical protein